MIRYIPNGCHKCDFSEMPRMRCCDEGNCGDYKESYIKDDIDCELGYASLEEFNAAFGTDWEEPKIKENCYMANLTKYDTTAGELLVLEEESLLSAKGYITHDEMYKIMRHLAEKLSEYERAEEQGLLLKLPCKVGDTVHYILGIPNKTPCVVESCIFELSDINKIGKTLFLKKSEAEQKLKEMLNNKN